MTHAAVDLFKQDNGFERMTKINVKQKLDDDFEFVSDNRSHRNPNNRRKVLDLQENRAEHAALDDLLRHHEANVGADAVFQPTFNASRHEREWILNYLGPFYDEEQITDVLFKIKGGKEANVYCCTGPGEKGSELVAAKIYRPRMFRNLRNDVRYRQNRKILNEYGKEVDDDRLMRAIQKGTGIGKEALHTSWLQHEFQALSVLHSAGVKVPRPIASGDNTILMEYFGDRESPAPALHEVRLSQNEARNIYQALLRDVDVMLQCGYVHGDLSAFNVLYFDGDYRIIDLPQAVIPDQNPDAWDIFQRDVTRLVQYFERYRIQAQPGEIARQMWRKHLYREDPLSEQKEHIQLMEEE
jgi:RIO kinase 1